jgi:hypothetical protein
MSTNMDILKTMLLTWTDEEVTEAWSLVAGEGERRRHLRTSTNKAVLKAGDKVSWSGRRGSMTGTIVRVKVKKAIVDAEPTMQRWDIPLSMLKKVVGA